VAITREMKSATNLSVLTTTLENMGGSGCSMTDFVFTDTIPSAFPALNEVAFAPPYTSREGWTVTFSFPTFAAGESKTLSYSANRWIKTSLAKNFTAYAMAAKKQEAAAPAAPPPAAPEEPSVWIPRKLPSTQSAQPAAQPAAAPAPADNGAGILGIALMAGAIAVVAGAVAFFVLRKKRQGL
jgi:hypothetical protein